MFICDENMIVDEICTHLNPQNKINMRNVLFNNCKLNKQVLLVTHDVEYISQECCNNIIYFGLEKNKTFCVTLKDKNSMSVSGKHIKIICENPQILFTNKVLFVEGYTDYLYMSALMKVKNKNSRLLMCLNGCGSKIWEIADKLKIDYKIMYDMDKLTGSPKNTTINTHTLHFTKKFFSDSKKFEYINNIYDNVFYEKDLFLKIFKYGKKNAFDNMCAIRTLEKFTGNKIIHEEVKDINSQWDYSKTTLTDNIYIKSYEFRKIYKSVYEEEVMKVRNIKNKSYRDFISRLLIHLK